MLFLSSRGISKHFPLMSLGIIIIETFKQNSLIKGIRRRCKVRIPAAPSVLLVLFSLNFYQIFQFNVLFSSKHSHLDGWMVETACQHIYVFSGRQERKTGVQSTSNIRLNVINLGHLFEFRQYMCPQVVYESANRFTATTTITKTLEFS